MRARSTGVARGRAQPLRRAALRRRRRQRGHGARAPARRAARAGSPAAQAPAVGGAVGGVQPRARAARRPAAARRARRRRAAEDRDGRALHHRGRRRPTSRASTGRGRPDGADAGGREKEPPPGTAARALEDEALAAVGATREDFTRAGRDCRARAAPSSSARWTCRAPRCGGGALRSALPAGSYATVVVAAVLPPRVS